MSTPTQRGWGKPPAARTVRVPCAGLALNLRPEVAPLFAELIARVEKINGRGWMLSSGGANFRPMRKYEQKYKQTKSESLLSNHSWALAADFRAATNPQMRNGPTDMPGNMEQICREISPHLSWGGTWGGDRRDPMHVEYLGTPDDAARDVARLNARHTVEAVVADLTREELDRVMSAVDNYNRTWNSKQQSKVDPKSNIWLSEAFMFVEANVSKIVGLLERIAKKVDA